MEINIRNHLVACTAITATLCFLWKKKKNALLERREQERIEELNQNEQPLSGVMLEEREVAFPYIGPLNKLLPNHQSLIFPPGPNKDGYKRHIGLGAILDSTHYTGYSRLTMTQWRLHEGEDYTHVKSGKVIPIEAWQKYCENNGNYPKVDVKRLHELTRIPEEYGVTNEETGLCGHFMHLRDINGRLCLHHCRTAVEDVIHKADRNYSKY